MEKRTELPSILIFGKNDSILGIKSFEEDLNDEENEEETNEELAHYGILGMKWGVRRYQNPDGSLTAKGRAHLKRSVDQKYGTTIAKAKKDYQNYKGNRQAQKERVNAYKQRRNLSDEQVKNMVQRLEAEKKMKSLIEKDIAPAQTWLADNLLKFGASAVGAAAGVIGAALAKEFLRKRGFPIGKGD